MDVDTRDKDNVIRELSELVLRVDKHRSISEYQNMATRTSVILLSVIYRQLL